MLWPTPRTCHASVDRELGGTAQTPLLPAAHHERINTEHQ